MTTNIPACDCEACRAAREFLDASGPPAPPDPWDAIVEECLAAELGEKEARDAYWDKRRADSEAKPWPDPCTLPDEDWREKHEAACAAEGEAFRAAIKRRQDAVLAMNRTMVIGSPFVLVPCGTVQYLTGDPAYPLDYTGKASFSNGARLPLGLFRPWRRVK